MSQSLGERIDEQDCWTFRECLGLADEYGTKTRFVIVQVLARGKRYIDGSADDGPPGPPPKGSG